MNIEPNNVEIHLRQLIEQYVLSFGRPVGDDIKSFISNKWDWSIGYSTQTKLLHGLQLFKQYDQQLLTQRFKKASQREQGMSLIGVESVSLNPKIVKWKGNFTAFGPLSSPAYEITSYFNEDCKFIKNLFVQVVYNQQQLTAPQLSWKSEEEFIKKK